MKNCGDATKSDDDNHIPTVGTTSEQLWSVFLIQCGCVEMWTTDGNGHLLDFSRYLAFIDFSPK